MKVLFVSSANINEGNQSILVLNQGNSLSKVGIDIVFYPLMGKGFLGYLKNIKLIKRIIKEQNIDIIHAHYGICGIVSYFAKGNAKLLVSFMGTDIIGDVCTKFKDKFIDFVIVKLSRWFAYYKFDHVIVKSASMIPYLKRGKNYTILPNGINFNKFYPVEKELARKELGLDLEKKIVLFASDPSRIEKNYTLAKEAVDRLSNTELLVVFKLTQEKLNLYYNAADVCLLTSLHEGSPNFIKETLASNRVIISTDVGDVKKNLGVTENCYITPFDSLELSRLLELALTKEKSNGREMISHLEEEKIALKIKSIYSTLIAK